MPTITYPTFDFSGLLPVLNGALTGVVMPAVPYLIGAAAITGAVTWIVKRGKSVVKLK